MSKVNTKEDVPCNIKERKLLFSSDDHVFSVYIPKNRDIYQDRGFYEHPYLLLRHSVVGGYVNSYVKHKNPRSLINTVISAYMEIWKSKFYRGNIFLYVNFNVIDNPPSQTHMWKIITKPTKKYINALVGKRQIDAIFHTPRPLNGAIVIVEK